LAEVTLISHSHVLPRYPAKFGERLALIYEREGIRVLTSCKIVRIARDSLGFYEIGTEGPDGYEPIMSEKVLIAAGRRPAVDDLHLEAAGICLSDKGLLEIGDDMRVIGDPRLVLHLAVPPSALCRSARLRDWPRHRTSSSASAHS